MDFNYFQRHDLFILFPALACLVASIVLYIYPKNERSWPSLLLLTLAALGLRVFMAHLDPYLWDWDERYHAMVARNFMYHPLVPTLYDHPVLAYDFKDWTRDYIWMHKLPLAMWQMALSFYFFGVNQFTARFPMVLEGTLMVLIIYRIGVITINKQAGYLSALIYTVSFYALSFMTGGEALDHVDYALLFYASASLWSWLEYRESSKMKWVILTGIFAGLAFMSKWIMGLVIFPVWGISILFHERKQLSAYINIGIAFIISIIVFMPWQIYTYLRFPVEYGFETNYNTHQHFFKVLEAHSGTVWYYLENLDYNYGMIVPYILPLGLLFIWLYAKKIDYMISITTFIIIPYLFFSLGPATKMPAYCYFVCAPIFLALGSFALFVQKLMEKLKWRIIKPVICLILLTISWFSIDLIGIAKIHAGYDDLNHYRINKVQFTDYFRKISKTVPKEYVIFGFPYNSEIEMMFYTGNTCYDNFPTFKEYKILKKYHEKIAIIQTNKTPDYLMNDPDVLKIKMF